LPSALLSKSIAKYNENLKDLIKFLRSDTVLSEINTERPFQTSLKEVCAEVEPIVINIRTSGSAEAEAAHQRITEGLV
jgi:hypothetical protein